LSVFAPLPSRVAGVSPTTGFEDVHLVALARLLTPVAHIQVDWQRYGPKLAQVALTFGADDVDAVSPVDEVAEGRRRAPLEEIRRNIRAASAEPVERDARFRAR
jgi:aminodeoxyfutalosine synthase